ncbi:hypothetical protein Tsubulata_021204 [Turnera subulata]|uniref:Tyrosine specific protein phosphatases domain-containing protein n=1 Tax=Turnera subulata TaxID=218843 RepID=A0A9Q0G9G7_9ROSI|nr:hypothetical protein Tsubulata_021204 [Turnera subulata]
MAAIANIMSLSSVFTSSKSNLMVPKIRSKMCRISCKVPESGVEENPTRNASSLSSKNRMEDYNTAMKRMMRNPYEYHHDLGGSSFLSPPSLHFSWSCFDARDFDPDSLRSILPQAVSSLEWAVSDGKGRVYVHCTAGLGRAPAVAIAYMFWFCSMNLNTAYETLTSKRPCGPNKRSIRGATYDLAKNDPGKEPFESLPEYAFEDIADWERNLIQDRVRSLRGT